MDRGEVVGDLQVWASQAKMDNENQCTYLWDNFKKKPITNFIVPIPPDDIAIVLDTQSFEIIAIFILIR